MAGKNTIQILRGNTANITNSDEVLLDGQPLYNNERNFITIGSGENAPLSQKPIAAREVIGYQGEDIGSVVTNSNSVSFEIGTNLSDNLRIASYTGGINLISNDFVNIEPNSSSNFDVNVRGSGNVNLTSNNGHINLHGDVVNLNSCNSYGYGGCIALNASGAFISAYNRGTNISATTVNISATTGGINIHSCGSIDLYSSSGDIGLGGCNGYIMTPNVTLCTSSVDWTNSGCMSVRGSELYMNMSNAYLNVPGEINMCQVDTVAVSRMSICYGTELDLVSGTGAGIKMNAVTGSMQFDAYGCANYSFTSSSGGNFSIIMGGNNGRINLNSPTNFVYRPMFNGYTMVPFFNYMAGQFVAQSCYVGCFYVTVPAVNAVHTQMSAGIKDYSGFQYYASVLGTEFGVSNIIFPATGFATMGCSTTMYPVVALNIYFNRCSAVTRINAILATGGRPSQYDVTITAMSIPMSVVI